ncbi:ATP-binding protein [Rhodospirillum sp. A1_3_36]|uniref:ATP-binding protein n=1 Tax=Rhodospirillum sp. A1_3_36 TaxID=3391666 RepID=UPI0039A47082
MTENSRPTVERNVEGVSPALSAEGTRSQSLLKWIWRSYLHTALVPLIFIELVFLGIYIGSHHVSTDRTLDSFGRSIETEFHILAQKEAEVLSERLSAVGRQAQVLAAQTARVLSSSCPDNAPERRRLKLSPDGSLYSTNDGGGEAALFYSGIVPIGPAQWDRAVCSARLDPLMRDIKDVTPLVDQIYFTTWDSMNRIYPYFNVLDQYQPNIDLSAFNFYFEADERNNPERNVVWTDVYLDLAGQGWMASALAPAYVGDRLEAVAGLDITVGTFINQILSLKPPFGAYAILLDRNGAILALPEKARRDWNLRPLPATQSKGPSSSSTAHQDSVTDPAENLFIQGADRRIIEALRTKNNGVEAVPLNGEDKLIAWARVAETGWTLAIVANRAEAFSEVLTLDALFTFIGYSMALGLLVFYLGFLAFLYFRARNVSALLATHLSRLKGMIRDVASGSYFQETPSFPIQELDETGREIVAMGDSLGRANEELIANREDLIRARDAAQTAARAKAEFLATMSHEIRTPMNAVIGMTGLLMESPLNERQTEYARTIQRSGEHLLGLINDILDFSRIDAGRLTLEERDFSLEHEIQSVVSLCGVPASAKRLPISVRLDPALAPGYRGDATRLRQILVNLVGNAVKFTDTGGVRIEAVPAWEKDNLHQLVIKVVDTGSGIPTGRLEDLFSAFQQLDGSATRRHGGTGLGLAISRRLARLMGGDIRVRSTPGEGSTFILEVPLAPLEHVPNLGIEEGPTHQTEQPPPAPTRPLRILLAEDILENQILAQAILEKQGHSVTVADDGRQALEHIHSSGPFDVVLMDIQMPVMDGIETTKAIRDLPPGQVFPDGRPIASLPIIAFTADALPGDRERFLTAGMNEHLPKPLSIKRLRSLLADVAANRPLGGGVEPKRPSKLTQSKRLLDPEALAQLRAALGEDYPIYLRAASESLRQRATALVPTLLRQDFEEASRLIHGLKGTLAAFGLETESALCARLRGDLAGGAGLAIRMEAETLAEQVLATVREVDQRLEHLPTAPSFAPDAPPESR